MKSLRAHILEADHEMRHNRRDYLVPMKIVSFMGISELAKVSVKVERLRDAGEFRAEGFMMTVVEGGVLFEPR